MERKGEDFVIIEDEIMKSRYMPPGVEYSLKLDMEAYIAKDDSVYVI